MADKTNYQNYKQPIKIWCIVQTVASALAILAIVFLFFLPNFQIDLSKVDEGTKTTLPKIEQKWEDVADDFEDIESEEDLENALKSANYVNFSFFDEMYATIKPYESKSENGNGGYVNGAQMASKMLLIYQILAAVCLVAAFALTVLSAVKSVLGIVSLDTYALSTYDELKRREKKKRSRFNPVSLFISGVVLEVFCIFFLKFMGGMIGSSVVTSYFALMSGMSGIATLSIVFIVFALIGYGIAKVLRSNLSTRILKDEYAEEE